MTVGPPIQIVFVPLRVGSPEPLRRARPVYPAKRGDQRWPLNQPIPLRFVPPASLIEDIRRRGKEMLEATRQARHSTP